MRRTKAGIFYRRADPISCLFDCRIRETDHAKLMKSLGENIRFNLNQDSIESDRCSGVDFS